MRARNGRCTAPLTSDIAITTAGAAIASARSDEGVASVTSALSRARTFAAPSIESTRNGSAISK